MKYRFFFGRYRGAVHIAGKEGGDIRVIGRKGKAGGIIFQTDDAVQAGFTVPDPGDFFFELCLLPGKLQQLLPVPGRFSQTAAEVFADFFADGCIVQYLLTVQAGGGQVPDHDVCLHVRQIVIEEKDRGVVELV